MAIGIADILKAATENISLAAEAEARLAAAGKVSIATWDRQAKAVEYLAGRQRLQENEAKRLTKDTVTLTKAFQDAQKSALIASATLAGTFAELRHMAGQANPGLLMAFDGAIGLLQARIAGSLLPVFDSVIDSIVDAADWFASLSDWQKKLLAGGVVFVPAMMGLVAALRALAPAALVARVALTKLFTTAKAGGAMGALTVGATGVGIAAVGIAGTIAAAENLTQGRRETAERTGRVREEELEQRGFSPEEIRRAIEGDEETRRRMGRIQEEQGRQELEQNTGMWERVLNLVGLGGTAHREATGQADVNLGRRLQEEGPVETKEEAKMRKQIRNSAMRVSAVQNVDKPRYSGLAEARQRLQLENLGRNRYEQEILREQREHRKEEIERLDRLITEFQRRFQNSQLYN